MFNKISFRYYRATVSTVPGWRSAWEWSRWLTAVRASWTRYGKLSIIFWSSRKILRQKALNSEFCDLPNVANNFVYLPYADTVHDGDDDLIADEGGNRHHRSNPRVLSWMAILQLRIKCSSKQFEVRYNYYSSSNSLTLFIFRKVSFQHFHATVHIDPLNWPAQICIALALDFQRGKEAVTKREVAEYRSAYVCPKITR